MPQGTPTPWSYALIRLLFRFVLKIFYGSIVVENTDLIPDRGRPCIICPNHSNSLVDALLLVTSVPPWKRNMLRMTAKATVFGRRTFSSWLIESTGTVPIKRRKDHPEGSADNTEVMEGLMQALELGDAVCMFPEGVSRYHPAIAPLKTGVARLVSDVLSRNHDNPNFEISVVTCSVTYIHRQHFRSDVLVTFHAPLIFTPKDNPELLEPVDFSQIKAVTTKIQDRISSGTFNSPSWDLVRTAKLAARMYAPLGTMMTLGDHVRLICIFIDAFKTLQDFPSTQDNELQVLKTDLKAYQDQLTHLSMQDDRIRQHLSRHAILFRMLVRLIWSLCLFTISFPGLVLWLPVFATTFYVVHNFKKTGPISDTWDEIAQYKLTYGLMSGVCVWISGAAITWPIAPVTVIFLIPACMWMTLRWLEDAVAASRVFVSLLRLLLVGKPTLKKMQDSRKDLHARLMNFAIDRLNLPEDPVFYFSHMGGKEKGRIQGSWDSIVRYFSLSRRRKRDWNEILRLYYDEVDYPNKE